MRQAEVPVFVARQKQHKFINSSDPTSVPGLATILCPVNFTDTARAALQHAVSLAQQFQARLVTPCIVEPSAPQAVAVARQELAAWLAEAGVGQCEIEPLARKGQAAEQIVALTGKLKADLVVLGAKRRSSLKSWPWGDTTEMVLRHAPAPVLVVPS